MHPDQSPIATSTAPVDDQRSAIPGRAAVRAWPAPLAVLTAPWAPVTTARRTQHVSTPAAFGAHLLAGTLALLALIAASMASQDDPLRLVGEALEEFVERPKSAFATTVAIVVGLETGVMLLALLVMPWGARDERISMSYMHALRRTWVHGGHAAIAILLVGTLVALYTQAWRIENRISAQFVFDRPRPIAPAVPSPAVSGTPAWKEYLRATQQYQRDVDIWNQDFQAALREFDRGRPFMIRHGQSLILNTGMLAGIWIIWALLRGVSVRDPAPLAQAVPLCWGCGYNLTAARPDGFCPECGRPTSESLLADARPGTPWERRGVLGGRRAWTDTIRDTFRRPSAPGRRMDVFRYRPDHGRLLLLNSALSVLVGYAVLTTLFIILFRERARPSPENVITDLAPGLCGLGLLIGLGWVGLCSVAVALEIAIRDGRNVAHATIRAASHHSGLFIPWSALTAALGAILIALDRNASLLFLRRGYGLDPDAVIVTVLTIVNLLPAIWYYVLVRKATMAARFANF